MKFGIREICDVVFKANKSMKIGNYNFSVGQPVLYIDSAKTSTLEGAATTVYATGGRGNSRLIAWEGEKTLTFTVEDALLSPVSFAMLSGAGLFNYKNNNVAVHKTNMGVISTKLNARDSIFNNQEGTWSSREGESLEVDVLEKWANLKDFYTIESLSDNYFHVYYEVWGEDADYPYTDTDLQNRGWLILNGKKLPRNTDMILTKTELEQIIINGYAGPPVGLQNVIIQPVFFAASSYYTPHNGLASIENIDLNQPTFIMSLDRDSLGQKFTITDLAFDPSFKQGVFCSGFTPSNWNSFASKIGVQIEIPVIIDYYETAQSAVTELTIETEKFAGNYYVEAMTKFKRQYDGKELDAMITFPNVKIQSNFTFNMAATGDPSTFTFTMDAMPGYTVQNPNKKVLCLMQIVDDNQIEKTAITEDSIFDFDWKEMSEGDPLVGPYFKIDQAPNYSEDVPPNEPSYVIKLTHERNAGATVELTSHYGENYKGWELKSLNEAKDFVIISSNEEEFIFTFTPHTYILDEYVVDEIDASYSTPVLYNSK